MDWQPIETAPRDETFVLLLFPKDPTCVMEHPYKIAFWSDYPDPEDAGWFESEASSNPVDELDRPTHWMPLPDPPEDE